MTTVELVRELKEFLSENRHHLTGEEIVLLDQVIEELKKVDESRIDPSEYLSHAIRVSELILKLFDAI